MAISAVAEPPVAIRMRFSEMTLLRSLHRTSILVAYASPFPWWGQIADLVSKGFRSDIFLGVDDSIEIIEFAAESD